MSSTVRVSAVDQVPVTQQHRVLILRRFHSRRKLTHHVRSVLVKRNSTKPFRFALRAIIPARFIQTLQSGVLLRLNRRHNLERKIFLRQPAHEQTGVRSRQPLVRNLRPVHKNRVQLHALIAV